jgi:hypothetical protein
MRLFGPTAVGVALTGLMAPLRWESVEMAGRSTAVGVSRFSSCAPLGGGDSYRVNGPTVVGVDR